MSQLPGYVITNKIYSGPDSQLFHGYRESDHRPVIIKTNGSEYPTLRESAKLRHEYAILQQLDTPGVVKTIALVGYGHGHALIMEDVGAKSLNELLEQYQSDLEIVLRIAVSLADTICHIHEQHVIHKDIKPHNILIEPTQQKVYLIDFGIASRLVQEAQRLQSPDALEGTLSYMSPEQTGRMNRVVDRRTDLYSFGITLYELLTGVVPFTSADPLELIHSHIARKPKPPHERNPQIPAVLSELVMLLLAKNAEDRYQNAYGVKADLEECLRRWKSTHDIAPFALKTHDQSGELLIPQKLYGREAELQTLLAAFERASQGAAELLLISGYAGVGKSALVNELHKVLAHRGGYFLSGKFEQYNRNIPYASMAQAFRGLLQQLLSQRPELLKQWKQRLLDALGNNAQVIIDVIPELELIIGAQPKVITLGPTEAQNRFTLVFQRFVRTFASAEHPLVLFLDDLQWTDSASLKLLQVLLTDPERGHLLVIGAYRDSEVDAAHLLSDALTTLHKTTTAVSTLYLQPLLQSDVAQLIADTLASSPQTVAPLASVVFEKTQGNPFFTSQFLALLKQDKLLSFDSQTATWSWDLEAMGARQVTANVVEFMAAKLRRLSPGSQQVLTLAACMGYQFDLASLAFIYNRSPAETAADLWEPLREGIVVPLSADYRLIYSEDPRAEGPNRLTENLDITYRFLHDRVQQAAYSLLEPAFRKELRLQIGRLLLTRTPDINELHGEPLITLVTHLNQAAELITEPEDRLRLARLNLLAGRQAKAATAYQAAADYFAAGAELLLADSWEEEHALCFVLYSELAECAHLSGRFDQAAALFDMLRGRARTDLERANLYERRIVLYITQNQFAAAVDLGREALAMFDIKLPETPEEIVASLFAEVATVQLNLAGRPIEEWLEAPLLTDPTRQAVRRLVMEILAPAFAVNPMLNQLLCVRLVNLSLVDGNSDVSPFGFMSYGVFLAIAMQQYQEAYRFGRFALDLNEKLGNVALIAKLNNLYGSFINYMCKPLRSGYAYFTSGIQNGLDAGDFPYASYNCVQAISVRLAHGDELGQVREEVEQFLTVMQRTRDAMSTALLTLAQKLIAALEGRTQGNTLLDDEHFSEAPFLAELIERSAMPPLYSYYQYKLLLLVLHEDYPAAVLAAAEADKLAQFGQGMLLSADSIFYAALAAVGLISAEHDEETQARGREAFARYKERAQNLAKSCPENFHHRYLLLEAEEARLSGKQLEAMELYEQAIALAQQGEFIHHEALANELCARFFLGFNRKKIASVYMRSAHYCYLRWGAVAKAGQLAGKYGTMLLQPSDGVEVLGRNKANVIESTRSIGAGLFDLATVMRAAQAISSEIVLDRVLYQVLRIVVTNAGAEQGYLILNRDGRLLLEAQIGTDQTPEGKSSSTPLETSEGIARSIVNYVARTREQVLLADALRDARFAQDPYIVAHNPKSVLCLPLLHQGRLTGVLYLENNEVRGAFTQERIELLRLLCSQAASAVENALLYTRVQQMTEQMTSSNQELSETNWRLRSISEQLRGSNQDLSATNTRLQEVTEQLRGSNQDLSAANSRLQVELKERARAEQERATLQGEIIAAQQARLAEMSTPLIPITDQIMVMPLIGAVDSQRAQQVLDTALQGAQHHGAQVVIIDITGMQHVDTAAANSLINTANALRLLGAKAMLTGIRAEVAQTLVSLGIDLGSIVTRGTLQSGIAYAIGQTGGSLRRRS